MAASTARVVAIGYRLAARGAARCQQREPLTGLALQSLDQFASKDRVAAIAHFHLDQGPRIVAVAPGSPGAAAGAIPGDIIASVDGRSLAPPRMAAAAFDSATALASRDIIESQVTSAAARKGAVSIMRDGAAKPLPLGAVSACPMHVHVANSAQRNAFADGYHVLLPTGFVDSIPDDNQLALVIAHEMAHNLLGHAAAQRASAGGARTALVRRQEDEADLLGADLALDAGFDVAAGSQVFRSGDGIDLFASHRDARQRIALIAAHVKARVRDIPAGP